MAVISISKIQMRSGLEENLPALDTGEFGWCVDTQRLYIGKGTLQQGAPTTGVTEVLTEYSGQAVALQLDELALEVANISSYISNVSSTISNITPVTYQLLDNQTTLANIDGLVIDSLSTKIVDYNITRNTAVRIGSIKVSNFLGNVVYDDEYTETASTGVNLYFTGNTITGSAIMGYTTTSTGDSANITCVYTDLRTIN